MAKKRTKEFFLKKEKKQTKSILVTARAISYLPLLKISSYSCKYFTVLYSSTDFFYVMTTLFLLKINSSIANLILYVYGGNSHKHEHLI